MPRLSQDTHPPQKRLDFTLYSKTEYYTELTARIAAAKQGDRVTIATLSFNAEDPTVQPVLAELYAAAQRGVRVHLLVDAFCFLISKGAGPGPLLVARTLPKWLPMPFRTRFEALERLKSLGGHYTITNWPARPFANPYAHRSHIKFAVVNDFVFVGGCNLSTRDILDLMAGWKDERTADWLVKLGRMAEDRASISQVFGTKDVRLALDATANLLIDAGEPGQSLILDTALELIDAARERVLITCQYFPNSVTARHLALAEKRGVKVEIIYNHPGQHVRPLNLLHHGVVYTEKHRMPPQFFDNQLAKHHSFLHAELLVADHTTLIGSHNYVKAGVEFGTAEIAVLSTDPEFGRKAVASLRQQIERDAG